jgi:hypothetical protein
VPARAAEPDPAQEKDDIPASSKLDLDADQSAQTAQMLRNMLGSKDVDALYGPRSLPPPPSSQACASALTHPYLHSAGA